MISNVPKTARENPIYQKFPNYSIYLHVANIIFALLGMLPLLLAQLKFIQYIFLAILILLSIYLAVKLQTLQFLYCYYIIKTRYEKVHQIDYEEQKTKNQNQQIQQFTHINDQAELSHYHSTFQQQSTAQYDVDRHYESKKQAYDQQELDYQTKQNNSEKRFSKRIHFSSMDQQGQSYQQNGLDQFEKKQNKKRGINMQKLWNFNKKCTDDRSVSGYSGVTQRTNLHSAGRSMAFFSQQSASYNYGDTIKSNQAKQEYQKYKRKLAELNILDYASFKNTIRKVQTNFIKELNDNFNVQIKNLERIKQVFEDHFYISIRQISQQLKQPSQDDTLKKKQEPSHFSQQLISIFDIIDKCMEKNLDENKLNQITIIYDMKKQSGRFEKSQLVRTIRSLIQDRFKLDKFLTAKPNKHTIKCQRKKYLQKIKNIIDYYQKTKGDKPQKYSSQAIFLPETPLILLNFLSITMKNAANKQIYSILPKIDAIGNSQKAWLRFKQLPNVRFNHFSLMVKQAEKQNPQIFPCINGQLNFWCALYFYFYSLSKKFTYVLMTEPGVTQVINIFLKK